MAKSENPTQSLHGMYHDVLRDARGDVIQDRGWAKNAIVINCRRLLASFMAGSGTPLGIDGLLLGAGSESWDQSPPAPGSTNINTTSLVDPNPHRIAKADLELDFLDGATVVSTPTNKLQVFAKLGPNVPNWPNGTHTTSSLREFGLVGRLGGSDVLLNYVIHPVITKDPSSTLERTLWLVF